MSSRQLSSFGKPGFNRVELVQDVRDEVERRRRVDGHPGSCPEVPDPRESAMQVLAGLDVDDHRAASGGDELRQPVVGILDHEVCFEGQVDVRSTRADDSGSERQVRDEAAVHHVPLDPVDAGGLEVEDLCGEAGVIGAQN
jgi:hypothetical protein